MLAQMDVKESGSGVHDFVLMLYASAIVKGQTSCSVISDLQINTYNHINISMVLASTMSSVEAISSTSAVILWSEANSPPKD